MSLATFKGGTHPYEGKTLSENSAIRELVFDGEYVFPLSQHIGAPAKPIVEAGTYVFAGQKLAEAGGFVSAPVISSVSGTVKAIEPRMMVSGFPGMSVVVESDGLFKTAEGVGTERDYLDLSKEEIVNIVKEAGIVGIGGAGFPTHVKLMPKNPDDIDVFIANGSECEPYLTSDYRLMLEEGEKIVGGLKICLTLFSRAKGIIAIESNKPEAIARMKKLTEDIDNIEVKELLTKYPEGGERQLINACTGRFINSRMLPADAGVIVDNVATLAAIYDAVALSTPLMQKVISVTGEAVASPSNVRVRIGSIYSRILEETGGVRVEAAKYICGGPMMGQALFDLNCPVTKPSSALLALLRDDVAEQPTTPCIRCGRCVEACPEFLIPQMMSVKAERMDLAGFEAIDGMECMECGSCTYVCPAKRPLTQLFKELKKMVIADRRVKEAEARQRAEHERQAKEDAEQTAAGEKAEKEDKKS